MKNDVMKFLLGEGPLDGVWFGDKHPTEKGAFWWRKHLRQFITQNQPNSGNTLLAVSGQPKFTIEEVIESIKTLWINDFGRLDSNSPDRDGYFVCGFVREALRAACASGGEAQSQSEGFYCADWNRCGAICEEQCPPCKKADRAELL